MNASRDLARQEEVVGRLRELHDVADDEDRPRAALLLGLAIGDLIAGLPDDAAQRGRLAAEGLARLAESAGESPAAIAARDLLRGCLPAAAEPAREPESFPLVGGDLNWDLDWDALRGPAEAARNLTEMLPFLASMFPPGGPVGRALTSIVEVINAFDQGQWSQERDAALATAIEQVEAGGLGTGLAVMLQAIAMMVRVRRGQEAEREGGEPNWPTLAELDSLIDRMESAEDLGSSLGAPFQAMDGMHHLFIAAVVMMRLMVSVRQPGVRRDQAWRNGLLRLLDRADDHLRQTPPAWAGQVRVMRGKLAGMFAALSQAPMPPEAQPSPTRLAPEAWPSPTRSPAEAPSSSTSTRPRSVAASPAAVSPSAAARPTTAPGFDQAMVQYSQRILQGLEIIVAQTDGPVSKGLGAMVLAMNAVNARKWTPESEARLAELEREADHPASAGESPASRATVIATLAVAHAVRAHQRSISPRPAEHPSAGEYAALIAETESALELLTQSGPVGPDVMAGGLAAAVLRAQAAMLLVDLSRLDSPNRAGLLARARAHYGQLPAELLDQMPLLRDMSVLEQLIEGVVPPDDEAVESVIQRNPNVWDESGGDLRRAMLAAARARQSRRPEDIGIALKDLQTVWIGLPAGSPMRAQVLISMAAMQSILAAQTGQRLGADAAATAIAALRAATGPGEVHAAAQLLVTTFSVMLASGQRAGPFREAEEALRAALADASAGDRLVRSAILTAIGAATTMRAAAADDEALRVISRQAIADAERLLPEPAPTGQWYAAARVLCTWATTQGLCVNDAESVRLALRLVDTLRAVITAHPDVTQQVTEPVARPDDPARPGEVAGLEHLRQQLLAAGDQPAREPQPPEPPAEEAQQVARRVLDRAAAALRLDRSAQPPRRPLAAGSRPDRDLLRSLAADLHAALASAVSDTRLRQQVNRMLGICHAELYWSDPAEHTAGVLREAVAHLNTALMADEHATPAVEWAGLLDLLARCLREVPEQQSDAGPPGTADRTVRAALRELARCVMIAEGTDQALELAAGANEIVARAIGWCLADGRPEAAVDIAEAGRGLVLASVVLSGRVEEVLRGAEKHQAADAWRAGSQAGRATALNALWETTSGGSLLSAPIGKEISVTMVATRFDAVVYLVPPAAPDSADLDAAVGDGALAEPAGHALLVRPVLGQVEVVRLPGLAAAGCGTPLDAYVAALDRALAEHDPAAGDGDGFRGGPEGQAWADALEKVGRWAYEHIMGPLLEHIRCWSLDHRPHLALIPLGELAAIPYAAAWNDDSPDGERRYAIDDLVLSYAASARLLGEAARRPPQPLSERVVLVSNPHGDLPMTRRATRLLASRVYPGAEVYGLRSELSGPATSEALLGTLPGRDRPGASLLQLSTHGTTSPTPALQTKDGWLALSQILDQARDRAPDAPGGLVVTNACLTDSTRTHYDESLTLATAFLAAGATSVIGTRWPVDDDTVAALSLRLHYHLQVGYQPAEALRRAQLDLLRPTADMRATLGPHLGALTDARLSHPATWAGHVHHGI